MHIAKFLV